jgi:hypothetical protein
MYGQVEPPWWDKQPVAVVGGGPSLKGFDFEALRGATVLAVKGTIFDIPWADAGFGLDTPRYSEWRDRLERLPGRVYWAVAESQLAKVGPPPRNVVFLKRFDGERLSDDPGVIYSGGTSGFGALQVCLHKRARRIVLFGYDYEGNYDSLFGFRHNDRFYNKKRRQSYANWRNWAANFRAFKAVEERGIEVVNACPDSQIESFRKVSLREGLALLNGG